MATVRGTAARAAMARDALCMKEKTKESANANCREEHPTTHTHIMVKSGGDEQQCTRKVVVVTGRSNGGW